MLSWKSPRCMKFALARCRFPLKSCQCVAARVETLRITEYTFREQSHGLRYTSRHMRANPSNYLVSGFQKAGLALVVAGSGMQMQVDISRSDNFAGDLQGHLTIFEA